MSPWRNLLSGISAAKLQAINKKAVIWLIQEFNDWNKSQGARARQVRHPPPLSFLQHKTTPNRGK